MCVRVAEPQLLLCHIHYLINISPIELNFVVNDRRKRSRRKKKTVHCGKSTSIDGQQIMHVCVTNSMTELPISPLPSIAHKNVAHGLHSSAIVVIAAICSATVHNFPFYYSSNFVCVSSLYSQIPCCFSSFSNSMFSHYV